MSAFAAMLILPILVIAAGVSDLFTMTIPNRISLLLVGCFFVIALLAGYSGQEFLMHMAAGAIVLALGFVCFSFGWMGGGDAKLAAATALWFGFEHLAEYLLVAMIGGGVLTLGLLSLRTLPLPGFVLRWEWLTRLHDEKTGIPYGIALAAAALMVYPETAFWRAGILGA